MIPAIEHIRHIFFLGIGGIGMSALARYFMSKGVTISGYDKTPSEITQELTVEGASIHYSDEPAEIPENIDLVIYTPAIPKDLKEFQVLSSSGLPVIKRSKAVGMITQGKTTVSVAGTHGKTSISSLIAHILMSAGYPVTALIGGISRNYGSNYISSGKEEIMVVEADEFDRSFLELEPDIAVISAMDPDHLDIYGTSDEMEISFAEFAARIKRNGTMVIRHDLQVPFLEHIRRIGYNVDNLSDYFANNLRTDKGYQLFDVFRPGQPARDLRMQVPGRHNVENAVAAFAVCQSLGLSTDQISRGIASFAGVKRRFDVRIRQEGLVYIDDYAHHPRELEAFITAVRELYPAAKITGLFQPHLFTRTRDFAEGFATSLDLLDEAWLLDIYPARELPIPGVDSGIILEKMKNPKKKLLSREEVLINLSERPPEVFLTIGAGDIDLMVAPIEKALLG